MHKRIHHALGRAHKSLGTQQGLHPKIEGFRHCDRTLYFLHHRTYSAYLGSRETDSIRAKILYPGKRVQPGNHCIQAVELQVVLSAVAMRHQAAVSGLRLQGLSQGPQIPG